MCGVDQASLMCGVDQASLLREIVSTFLAVRKIDCLRMPHTSGSIDQSKISALNVSM